MMRIEPFILFIVFVFASCASLEPAGKRSGLAAVEGIWIYNHMGKPSVWKQDLPDPSELSTNMGGRRISISKDGRASLLSIAGDQGSFRLRVAEESDRLIRLEGAGLGEAEEFSWTYDKKSRWLIMPLNLELPDGSTGTISAYFRKES